jgi:hypothetical protein
MEVGKRMMKVSLSQLWVALAVEVDEVDHRIVTQFLSQFLVLLISSPPARECESRAKRVRRQFYRDNKFEIFSPRLFRYVSLLFTIGIVHDMLLLFGFCFFVDDRKEVRRRFGKCGASAVEMCG